MTYRYYTGASVAAYFVLSAGFAFADVTADQIWKNWQELGAASGQTYTAQAETRAGNTLTLRDLKVESSSGPSHMKGLIPELIFSEMNDGTVQITMSDSYTLTMEVTNPEGKKNSNSFHIRQDDLVLKASGSPDSINYDISAGLVAVKMLDFVADGKPRDIEIDVDINAVTAAYAVAPGDPVSVNSTFAAQSINFDAHGPGAEDKGSLKFNGQMRGIAGASAAMMPKIVGTVDLQQMMASGFGTDGAFTYNSGDLQVSTVDEQGRTVDFNSQSNGGSLNFSMDRGRIAYGGSAKNVSMKASGSAIPFPELTAAYDEAVFNLLVPVAKAEEPQDFAFTTKLVGLTVSDMLWGMIDPAATLPRDPATLIIETSGKVKPLVDLFDADKMGQQLDGPPAELNALDINALQLTVAGAELKGSGALTFDNSQSPMLGGVAPMPEGKLNLTLDGANGLLGKLQALGLIDPNMVMGFGMMSAMLAKPGTAPDSLISEIEFKAGKILANGNPLPF